MLKVQNTETKEFSPELLNKFQIIVDRHPHARQKSALLPIRHGVQAEQGWLSAVAMDRVESFFSIEPIEVYEVATFYTMYFLKPHGKYVLEICRTGPCCL